MSPIKKGIGLLAGFVLVITSVGTASSTPAEKTYQKNCASCHGMQRYGGEAPPLLPQFLRRKKDPALQKLIEAGLPSTQMPPFGQILKTEEIQGLVQLLRQPVDNVRWTLGNIRASRKLVEAEPGAVAQDFDREDTMLVVERGTGSIAVFDGNTMGEVDKFKVGRIHGGPKFDQNYETVYAITRDGTLSWYDLKKQQLKGSVKVAVNTRNIAITPDAQWVVAANQLPQNVVILDHALNPLKVLPLEGKPSAVYQLTGEKKFILTLKDRPQMLIIDYANDFKVETIELSEPFEDFMFVPGRQQFIASLRKGKEILLYSLKERKVLGRLATKALPHLFSAAFYEKEGVLHAALNHIGLPQLSIINMDTFKTIKEIPLKGSGYFVRTHPETPYIWVDTNTEFVQIIDKANLGVVSEVQPQPGKKAMHIEFTTGGEQALVSVWHPEGAVVVYDAESFAEKKRIPFKMPIGKYNAYNKTRPFYPKR